MIENLNEILWQIHEVLNVYPYLIVILLILISNFFMPASIIVIFLISAYGLNLGIFLSLIVLILSSLIPFFIYRHTSIKLEKFLNEKYFFIYKSALKKNVVIYLIIIRLMSFPFVIQNILCCLLSDNFKKYIITSFIGSIFWIFLLAFFYSQIISLKFEFMAISIILLIGLLWLSNYKVKKHLKI